MRVPILLLALAVAGGCASSPDGATNASEAKPRVSSSSASSSAGASSAKTVVSATARKTPGGYRLVQRDGQDYYCRKEKPLGSNIARTVCLTPDEYKEVQARADDQKQEVRKRSMICPTPSGVCGD